MGSEVQLEHYMPGYCSTRELGEEASSRVWNYYDRQSHGTSVDFNSERDRDGLKQKMLEHDAVFRRQVSELHRLYRTQRDLMDEMKRSKLYNPQRMLSVNPCVYQRDSSKPQSPNFPSSNSASMSSSILGTERSSPNLSFLKRKAPKTDLHLAKDVDDNKDCQIIECRPGKVKRKMFDLQLSADAYIDTDEPVQSIDLKARIPSGSCNGQSFFSGRSESTCKRNGMKDLNEPIQIEDDQPTMDFMSIRTSRNDPYEKPFSLETPPKNYSRESSLITRYRGDYIDSKKQLLVDRESNRAQASHQLSLGKFNTNASTPVFPDQSKDKFWKDRMAYSPNYAEVGHEPQIHGHNRRSDVKCWPPPVTSWEKYGCDSSKIQPYFISSAGLSKGSKASNQPSVAFSEKLNKNSVYVVGIPRIDDLDHGSSSGSKDESICYPSVKFENLGCGKDSPGLKGRNGFDLNCCEEMDLSASLTNVSHHELPKMERSKHVKLLPWMKPKLFSSNTAHTNFSQTVNKISSKIERGNMASQCPPQIINASASHDNVLDLTKTTADHTGEQIHGFPVFKQPLSAGSFRLSKGRKSETERDFHVFDMNMPCEFVTLETPNKQVTVFKNLFDLNSCLTENEASANIASSAVRNIRGIDLEAPAPYDIEEDNTFVALQQTPQDAELELVAAEAMVSFSKNSNIMERAADAATETLNWFVGILSSSPSDSKLQSYEYPLEKNEEPLLRASSEENDYFEQMTLNLTEMSAEEGMPKTAFPSIPNIEEEPVKIITSARPRRGQARRGRPKRDFQRDILPGITSLARHEVTEDLQALDGLMQSSGHSWQYGKRAAARNKPRRGRPRTVNVIPVPDPTPFCPPLKQPSTNGCFRSSMEDSNLTGWGKTTRRPRGQRCPAGNLQPIRSS